MAYVYQHYLKACNTLVYIGKGNDARDNSFLKRSPAHKALFDAGLLGVERVFDGLTDAEAFSHEGQLIAAHDMVRRGLNLVEGLSAPKRIDVRKGRTIHDYVSVAKASARGRDSATPRDAAQRMAAALGDMAGKRILVLDKYSELLEAARSTNAKEIVAIMSVDSQEGFIEMGDAANGDARIRIVRANFMAAKDLGKFDAVLMNPPFDKTTWVDFIRAALAVSHGQVLAIVPQGGKLYDPFEHVVLAKDIRFTGTTRLGRVIAIQPGTPEVPLIKGPMPVPAMPNVEVRNITWADAADETPCIAFYRFVGMDGWTSCSEIVPVKHVNKVSTSGTSVCTGPGLSELHACLQRGGLQHTIARRRELVAERKSKTSSGSFISDVTQRHVITWLNEAWTLYGPK